jgi:AGZA family xanthine/uracil permease-like MFS transporter
MMSHAAEIKWNQPVEAIPAFLTLVGIPMTFSIANGLALGFTAYALLRILRGEFRKHTGWSTCWRSCLLRGLCISESQGDEMLAPRQ